MKLKQNQRYLGKPKIWLRLNEKYCNTFISRTIGGGVTNAFLAHPRYKRGRGIRGPVGGRGGVRVPMRTQRNNHTRTSWGYR